MKKNKIVLLSITSIFLFASCASTPESSETKPAHHSKPPKAIISQETKEDTFIKSLEGISVQKLSSPKEISKGKTFAAPFIFSVTKADGSPVENFALTITYPSEKTEEGIIFGKTELITNAEGQVTFTAEQPAFAAKSKVSAFPTPVSEDPSLPERLKPFTAEADWKVKSDLASKGAVLFVWDYNEKDRPVNNSYNIQAEFRGRGITMVGNGPVNETSYIGKPKALYKDTYDIIGGNQYGYLIYGTIKFDQPVTENEEGDGYYCVLKAEIEAVNMKNGNKIYSAVTTYESKGKNWNECVSKGKDKLAELVVSDIIYGL